MKTKTKKEEKRNYELLGLWESILFLALSIIGLFFFQLTELVIVTVSIFMVFYYALETKKGYRLIAPMVLSLLSLIISSFGVVLMMR